MCATNADGGSSFDIEEVSRQTGASWGMATSPRVATACPARVDSGAGCQTPRAALYHVDPLVNQSSSAPEDRNANARPLRYVVGSLPPRTAGDARLIGERELRR